jgi:pimeloyl-ACP methyl ester carboxylesterase
MPFANASGATIHYAVEGGGPHTLLLVMGLGGHASEWGSVFVADLATDHQIVRMDNRGIAQSQTSAVAWTLEDMASDVLAVIDALGRKDVFLVGTSMGGMIAQLVAAHHPSRVSRLVLMSTSSGAPDSVPPEQRAVDALTPVPGMSIAEQRRKGLRTLTTDGFADDHADLIELLVAQRERNPTPGPVFKAQFEAIVLSDRFQAVHDIRCPTLIVHGDRDPLIPVQNGRALARAIPGSTYMELESCGHLPHLEKPVETAKLIREFLARPA